MVPDKTSTNSGGYDGIEKGIVVFVRDTCLVICNDGATDLDGNREPEAVADALFAAGTGESAFDSSNSFLLSW